MINEAQEFVTTLKGKVNIVEVLKDYLPIEKKGNAFWACCPFHNDKMFSFAISETDQSYHCFGCGECGDVIKFVQEVEHIGFYSSLKLISDKVGITIPNTIGES